MAPSQRRQVRVILTKDYTLWPMVAGEVASYRSVTQEVLR